MKKITFLLVGALLSLTLNAQTSAWSDTGESLSGFTTANNGGDQDTWSEHTDFFGYTMQDDYGFTYGTVLGSYGYDYVTDLYVETDDLLYTPDDISVPEGATNITFSMEYTTAEAFSFEHTFYVYAYENGTTVDFDNPGIALIATKTTIEDEAETKQDLSAIIPNTLAGKDIGIIIRDTAPAADENSSILYVGNFDVSYEASLSIKDNQLAITKVYPNPVKDMASINSKFSIESAIIYNQLGQKVLSLNDVVGNRINLSTLNKGLYFISLKGDDKVSTIRIIKE